MRKDHICFLSSEKQFWECCIVCYNGYWNCKMSLFCKPLIDVSSIICRTLKVPCTLPNFYELNIICICFQFTFGEVGNTDSYTSHAFSLVGFSSLFHFKNDFIRASREKCVFCPCLHLHFDKQNSNFNFFLLLLMFWFPKNLFYFVRTHY